MAWDLLKAVLWLRWRLTVNQASRAQPAVKVLITLLAVGALVVCAGLLVGGVALGALVVPKIRPVLALLIIDGVVLGFTLFWVAGIMSEIQRSESIDLQRLLHLPVKLRDVFVVNYVASHFSISVCLLVSVVVGLTLGVLAVGAFRVAVLFPLVLSYVFAVSAWTYCLRGWLVQIMVNPRRKRTIVIALTAGIILLVQAPNIFFNVYLRNQRNGDPDHRAAPNLKSEEMVNLYERAHYFVPPLWVSASTTRAMDGNVLPTLGVVSLFSLIGYAGLRRAYRSTLRFYQGCGTRDAEGGATREKPLTKAKPERVARPLGGSLPGLPDDVSVVTRAFWRSMMRAPEIKMALLGPVVVGVIIVVMMLSRGAGSGLQLAAPLVVIGVTLFSLSGLFQIVFNQFGWDREGFRALVLSPMDRCDILLAKNLALLPLMMSIGSVLYVGLAVFLKMPLSYALGGLLQIATAAVILCLIGNAVSIHMAYRVQLGSLKPTKVPVKNVIGMIFLMLAFPIYMLPVIAGPVVGVMASLAGLKAPAAWNLIVSAVMCGVAVFVYRAAQGFMGRMLQERETQILQTVTSELE